VSLEGELQVRLHLGAGQIQRVEIGSTRPDVAQRLLQGRSRAEVLAAIPLMFSICGRSQSTAATLAFAAAAGIQTSADARATATQAVAAEMLRELTWLSLLQWPQRMAETPSADAVAAARASLGPIAATAAQRETIALAAFGMPASSWLGIGTLSGLEQWAAAGHTAAARFIQRSLIAQAESGTAHSGLLPARPTQADWAWLAQAMADEPDFAHQPRWHGAAAETGALARWQSQALIAALLARSPSRVAARLVARLHELALLLADTYPVALGSCMPQSGTGMAWVENARGLLAHRVQVDPRSDKVLDYRIVAPTEWNLHASGPLATALTGAPVADADQAQSLANAVIHSLDPCVACRVEIVHA